MIESTAMAVTLIVAILLIGTSITLLFFIIDNYALKRALRLERKTVSETIYKLQQEKEKHPEIRDEYGWTYIYEPETYFVGRYHENGKGKQSICEISRSQFDRDCYGYLIADLLNKNIDNKSK